MAYAIQLYVLEDHLHKVIEEIKVGLAKFGDIHKIPFEGKWLIDTKLVSLAAAQNLLKRLMARGIAFNSFGSYGSNPLLSARFNHMGELLVDFTLDQSEGAIETRNYLSYTTWPDGVAVQKASDRAIVVTMRYDWDDQEKYGRIYSMLNVLGS